MTGGINVWSSYQASIDMLEQYDVGDTIRRNATFCTPGTYYPYICIANGGYTYDGNTSSIKKGVPGGPDDDNDGYIQSMNSPLNTYILRLADVYLTYAEACLGDDETRQCPIWKHRILSATVPVFHVRKASPLKTLSVNVASSFYGVLQLV